MPYGHQIWWEEFAKLLFFPWDFRLHPEKELYRELYMRICIYCECRAVDIAAQWGCVLYRALILWAFGEAKGVLGEKFISRGVLNFELGTDVRPEVSTTTLLNQRGRKFATYV